MKTLLQNDSSIDFQIQLIRNNYNKIFDDLKKFDSYKDIDNPKKIVPSYYRVGMRYFDIVNNQEKIQYCSDISGLIQVFLKENGIKCKVVYGYYRGKGVQYNRGLWDSKDQRRHAWIQLEDGTIVDGSYRQFNSSKTKISNLKFLNILRPTDSNYNDYEIDIWYYRPHSEPLPYILEAKNHPYNLENSFWWKRNKKARKNLK